MCKRAEIPKLAVWDVVWVQSAESLLVLVWVVQLFRVVVGELAVVAFVTMFDVAPLSRVVTDYSSPVLLVVVVLTLVPIVVLLQHWTLLHFEVDHFFWVLKGHVALFKLQLDHGLVGVGEDWKGFDEGHLEMLLVLGVLQTLLQGVEDEGFVLMETGTEGPRGGTVLEVKAGHRLVAGGVVVDLEGRVGEFADGKVLAGTWSLFAGIP